MVKPFFLSWPDCEGGFAVDRFVLIFVITWSSDLFKDKKDGFREILILHASQVPLYKYHTTVSRAKLNPKEKHQNVMTGNYHAIIIKSFFLVYASLLIGPWRERNEGGVRVRTTTSPAYFCGIVPTVPCHIVANTHKARIDVLSRYSSLVSVVHSSRSSVNTFGASPYSIAQQQALYLMSPWATWGSASLIITPLAC